jgi:UDP-N-acetylmuramate-alanine ligase
MAHFRRRGGAPVEPARDLTDAAARIEARWRAGDWILIIGAGDIEALGPMLAERLGAEP